MGTPEQIIKQALSKYKYADIAKRDITNTLSQFKDLRPGNDYFNFSDGSRKELLNLKGTIPVNYKGNVYNIPIGIWILDTHPYNPPMVFVNPTSTKHIKQGRNVDANGKVDLPYLRDWRYPQSDLLGLIQILVIVFGEEPPLFSGNTKVSQPRFTYPGNSPYPFMTPYPSQADVTKDAVVETDRVLWNEGRRVVDLSVLAEGLSGCKKCGKPLQLSHCIGNTNYGLAGWLTIPCLNTKCEHINHVPTGKRHRGIFDINTKLKAAIVHTGIGEKQLNGLLSMLDIPPVSHSTLDVRQTEPGKSIETIGNFSIQWPIEEEFRDVKEKTGKDNLDASVATARQGMGSGKSCDSFSESNVDKNCA